ncbi:50S ribosomal protein L4 [Campylobacter sp. FMV-PI01]|uniref:Large ribosomal subunit protein uL4 n=1 Tax=Campylobacter portucalensis TaxID=2608384 RepID=A0A6L5WK35_9BACT|nr:50S ribosomal protein L4 [Campylobacter portucalensis]MSN96213.1 50S ribosomal protein L4 [Campylobacter portucalensis]
MSKIAVLNEKLEKASELELPSKFSEVNSHNLYLYVKSYLASCRANTAHTKGRSDVSGGGKKPWRQKGRGGARAGSTRTNVWVGGAVAFGPKNNRNYFQKVNKKQKRLALEFALNEKANAGKFFVVDSLEISSGKTKDAANFIKNLGVRDALIVKNELDSQTLLAYRNLNNCWLIDSNEINGYLVAVYSAIVIEKAAYDKIVKEG